MTTRSKARRHRGTHPIRIVAAPTETPGRKLWPASNPHDAVEWWAAQVAKPLFVYFITDKGGPVKIGKAYDPRVRLSELQCGNPQPLTLSAVVLANARTERALHKLWKGFCIRGEWFGADQAMRILELAKRAQRQQIDALRRGIERADIENMPADIVSPATAVAIHKRIRIA